MDTRIGRRIEACGEDGRHWEWRVFRPGNETGQVDVWHPDWSSQAAEELQPKTSTAPRHERSVR